MTWLNSVKMDMGQDTTVTVDFEAGQLGILGIFCISRNSITTVALCMYTGDDIDEKNNTTKFTA